MATSKSGVKVPKYVYLLVPVVLLLGYFLFFNNPAVTDSTLKATVKKGDFVISVTATGELKPVNSVAIKGPTNLRDYNIYQVKIQDLIPEGTIVKKGDFVAELDRSEVTTKLMERQNDLAKYEAQILQARLDTTLTLRQARDEINNLIYELKNKELILQQSKYEPPATIKQAELDLEKGQRALKQARENYLIKRRQARAKIDEIATSLTSSQIKLKGIMELMGMLTITATEPGMVIYERSWGGEKIKTGSQISVWDPTVATLPDLTRMQSKTFVNEIDIRKLKVGQKAEIALDAFSEKKLTGKVTSVSNVGEQRPNSEAKVFEVLVEIDQKDTTLRPAMTTSNKIISEVLKNVMYVPLEAVFTQGDTIRYVFTGSKGNPTRKEVRTGVSNETDIVITEGLAAGDEVLLETIVEPEKLPLILLPKAAAVNPKNQKASR